MIVLMRYPQSNNGTCMCVWLTELVTLHCALRIEEFSGNPQDIEAEKWYVHITLLYNFTEIIDFTSLTPHVIKVHYIVTVRVSNVFLGGVWSSYRVYCFNMLLFVRVQEFQSENEDPDLMKVARDISSSVQDPKIQESEVTLWVCTCYC